MVELNQMERKKIEIIEQVISKEKTQMEAAVLLNLSDRQIRRLITKYKTEGQEAFIHKNRGKISSKKISEKLISEIINDYLSNFSNYNFEHFYEEQGIKYGISYSTMVIIFKSNDIISPLAQHKTVRLYNELMRNAIKDKTITETQEQLFKQRQNEEKEKHIRKSSLHYSFGQEVQIDAAFWIWFNDFETALHLAVDKATKKVLYGWFSYEETTESYMILLMNVILRYGIPEKIKTDRRGTFSINSAKKSKSNLNTTQFGRICQDLEIILSSSSDPLFKPNVERENGTFKRRLKAELEHNHINDMEAANKYLNEIFIPKMNQRFSYDIDSNKNRMRTNSYSQEELNIIISIRLPRIFDNACCIKFFNNYYFPTDIETGEVINFTQRTKCTVINSYDKTLFGLINDKLYNLNKIETNQLKNNSNVSKNDNHSYSPSQNHPWRKNMMLRK